MSEFDKLKDEGEEHYAKDHPQQIKEEKMRSRRRSVSVKRARPSPMTAGYAGLSCRGRHDSARFLRSHRPERARAGAAWAERQYR